MSKLTLNNFDAVAFDLEGTLADTLPAHHAARMEAFAMHGFSHVTLQEHQLGPTYGSSSEAIAGGILHAAGLIDDVLPFDQNPIVQSVTAYGRKQFTQKSADGFAAMPGAIEFLQDIAQYFPGKIALVTSAHSSTAQGFINKYDLAQYFTEIITLDSIEALGLHGKPAADPYRLAMERLSAKQLLVFEDTVPGVASAKQAGASVIAVTFDSSSRSRFDNAVLLHPPDAVVENYQVAAALLF